MNFPLLDRRCSVFQKNLLAGKRILITADATGLGKSMGQRFLELGGTLRDYGFSPAAQLRAHREARVSEATPPAPTVVNRRLHSLTNRVNSSKSFWFFISRFPAI